MLTVSNKYEAATLVLSWHMYEQLWELMTITGLVYLPFFKMVYDNFVGPITEAYTTSASHFSLKKMEIGLIQALIVIVLIGQPLITLKLDQVQYTKYCDKQNANNEWIDADPVNQGTNPISKVSYGNDKVKTAKMPLWWYAVYSFSTGFTEASKKALPCATDARAMLVSAMQTGIVKNQGLRSDLLAFSNQCWSPAKVKANEILADPEKAPPAEGVHPGYAKLLADENAKLYYYEKDDTQWLGSWVFLGMGTHQSKKKDFYGFSPITISGPGFGRNDYTCFEWWTGVRPADSENPNEFQKYYYEIIKTYFDAIRKHRDDLITNGWSNDQANREIADAIMNENWMKATLGAYARGGIIGRSLFFRVLNEYLSTEMRKGFFNVGTTEFFVIRNRWDNLPLFDGHKYGLVTVTFDLKKFLKTSYDPTELAKTKGTKDASGRWLQEKAFNLGARIIYFGTMMLPYVVGESFPIIQAMLLLGICMFLGIGLVFSGYDFEQYCIQATVALFTLKFLGFLLYFCKWVDNNLIFMVTGQDRSVIADFIWSFFDSPSMHRLFIDFATAIFYVTLPSLYVAVMAWAGHQAAETVSSAASGMRGGFDTAGKAGASAAGSAVSAVGGGAVGLAKAGAKKMLGG